MWFCAASNVPPEAFGQADFDAFARALDQESLARRPQQVLRTAGLLWNRATEEVDGWPQTRVTVPNRRRTYALPASTFPASFVIDLDTYIANLANPDPLADDGRKPASPITVRQRRLAIFELATAAVARGVPIDSFTSLAALVDPEVAKQALRFFLDRLGGKTERVHRHAVLLTSIAKHWVKADAAAVEQLRGLAHRLAVERTGLTRKNRDRLRPFEDPVHVEALLGLPRRLLADARRNDRGRRIDAVKVALALAIELLTVAPMRIKNLAGLRVDCHLLHSRPGSKGSVHLVLGEEETKNGEPYELALPADTVVLLKLYQERYRPRLADAGSPWLFPAGDRRGRRSTEAFARQISACIARETGLTINVHLFRHLAAMLHLRAYPGDYETVRRLLGHKSIATTTGFYTGMEVGASFERYDSLIQSLRAAGEQKRRQRRGERTIGDVAV